MFNKVILVGNLTKEVKTKKVKDNLSLANFGIVTAKRKPDEVFFGEVVAFGVLADYCEKYFYKGARVMVIGRLVTSKWGDSTQKKYTTQIIAESVNLLSPPKSNIPTPEEVEPVEIEPEGEMEPF